MTIYLGADHRGFALKELLKKWLEGEGYEVTDMGAHSLDVSDDYVDFAKGVAEKVSAEHNSRGIVLCGSGVGVDITANKISGIRSVLGFNEAQVASARADDDCNVLSLAANFVDQTQARQIVHEFLQTPFKNEEKYLRRLTKLTAIENNHE